MAPLYLFLALAACSVADTAATFVTSHGTVYRCDEAELCWDGSQAELERLTGATCSVTERWWPRIVGCSYCCGDGCPRGCDAHQGCFCPVDGAP